MVQIASTGNVASRYVEGCGVTTSAAANHHNARMLHMADETNPINPFAVCEYPCTDARYFADASLNASTIKACVASLNPLSVVPAKGRVAQAHPPKASAAMITGSAAHALILEGEKVYAARYAVMPTVDRRTKAGKAEVAAWIFDNANKTGITEDVDAQVRRMAAAVRANTDARRLLRNGNAEQGIFWTDRATHVACKARLDYVTPDGVVVDLKTCQDATEEGFGRAVANFRYHVQAAFYRRAYREFFGGDLPSFMFIAVEKTAPHSVGVCELDEGTLDAADDIINIALRLWSRGDAAAKDYGQYTVSLRRYQNHLLQMEETA
jgi:hypothetical protein